MEFFNCQSAPKKMPLSDSLTHRRPKRSTQKTCVYQIPQPKKEFSNCQSVRKNMPLSDSLTHGRPRWTFNAQQKHAFIRFPKPSEAKEPLTKKKKKHIFIRSPNPSVPRWPFQLSISTKKYAFIRFPNPSVPRWPRKKKKNMLLSDSLSHQRPRRTFFSGLGNIFIRFSKPPEVMAVRLIDPLVQI